MELSQYKELLNHLSYIEIDNNTYDTFINLEYVEHEELLDIIKVSSYKKRYSNLVNFYNLRKDYREYIDLYILAYITILTKNDKVNSRLILYTLYILALINNRVVTYTTLLDFITTYGLFDISSKKLLIKKFKINDLPLEELLLKYWYQ